jgi:hypothetical protein
LKSLQPKNTQDAPPHVAQNTARPGDSAIDARSIRYAGYDVSQKRRERIEECFGWLKIIALPAPTETSRTVQNSLYFHHGPQLTT